MNQRKKEVNPEKDQGQIHSTTVAAGDRSVKQGGAYHTRIEVLSDIYTLQAGGFAIRTLAGFGSGSRLTLFQSKREFIAEIDVNGREYERTTNFEIFEPQLDQTFFTVPIGYEMRFGQNAGCFLRVQYDNEFHPNSDYGQSVILSLLCGN